jgi:hypothetical protein
VKESSKMKAKVFQGLLARVRQIQQTKLEKQVY